MGGGQNPVRSRGRPHLSVDRPALLDHGVEARRHGGVLAVGRAWRARRAGAAVVGRVGHGGGERAGHGGGLRRAKQLVGQGVCGDWGTHTLHSQHAPLPQHGLKNAVLTFIDAAFNARHWGSHTITYLAGPLEGLGGLLGWGPPAVQGLSSQTLPG